MGRKGEQTEETPAVSDNQPPLAMEFEPTNIAELVMIRRMMKRMSRQELADKCGVTVSAIAQIENGKRSDVSLDTGFKLAEALELDIRQLRFPHHA